MRRLIQNGLLAIAVGVAVAAGAQEPGEQAVGRGQFAGMQRVGGTITAVSGDTVTVKAKLKVGDWVKAGQYLGDEGSVGCAMLHHVHFEVSVPKPGEPIDAGGFLTDNEDAKRERNPQFCGVASGFAVKGATYVARPCE